MQFAPRLLALATLLVAVGPSVGADRTPEELLDLVEEQGDKVPAAVLEELGALGTEEALDCLVEATGELTTPAKLRLANHAFRHFAGDDDLRDEARQHLSGWATDQRDQKGVHATLALAQLAPDSGPSLVAIAEAPMSDDHRAAALSALVETMHRLDDKLVRKLAKSRVLELRYEGLLEEVRRMEPPEKRVSRLTKLHHSRAEAERLAAVELLGGPLGESHPERLALLAASLDDAYRPVARKALASLARTRTLGAVELLVARLDGARPAEVWHVTGALAELTGLALGSRAGPWQRWWQREGATFQLPDQAAAPRPTADEGDTRASFYGLSIHDDHVVFAVDTSDSMKQPVARTDGGRRIDVAQEELRRAIEGFDDGATFDLVSFGKSAWSWQGELVALKKRTRQEALDRVDDLRLSWGTEVHGGLREAFRDPDADAIVFLTDGDPQLSVLMDRGTIQRLVGQWNRTRHTTIDCVTIGTERAWLKKLAEQSGGRYRKVD